MACCRRQTASRRPRFRAGQPTPGRGSLMSVPVDVGACRGLQDGAPGAALFPPPLSTGALVLENPALHRRASHPAPRGSRGNAPVSRPCLPLQGPNPSFLVTHMHLVAVTHDLVSGRTSSLSEGGSSASRARCSHTRPGSQHRVAFMTICLAFCYACALAFDPVPAERFECGSRLSTGCPVHPPMPGQSWVCRRQGRQTGVP